MRATVALAILPLLLSIPSIPAVDAPSVVTDLVVSDGISFTTLTWRSSAVGGTFDLRRSMSHAGCDPCETVVIARGVTTTAFVDQFLPAERHGLRFDYEVRHVSEDGTSASPWTGAEYWPWMDRAVNIAHDFTFGRVEGLLRDYSPAPEGSYESLLLGVAVDDERTTAPGSDAPGALVLSDDGDSGTALYLFATGSRRSFSEFRAEHVGAVQTRWCSMAGPVGFLDCVRVPTSTPIPDGTQVLVEVTLARDDVDPALFSFRFDVD